MTDSALKEVAREFDELAYEAPADLEDLVASIRGASYDKVAPRNDGACFVSLNCGPTGCHTACGPQPCGHCNA